MSETKNLDMTKLSEEDLEKVAGGKVHRDSDPYCTTFRPINPAGERECINCQRYGSCDILIDDREVN